MEREELGEFYSRRHGIRTIAYRLGMFVQDPFVQYGFRLLKGGVDDRDVAQAFLLGLENQSITFDTFNIMGYRPAHNFDQFYAALLEGNEDYYPYADFPWRGM